MRTTGCPSKPLVSFVIPVLNDAANLTRCLMAIKAQADIIPVEIVVLDNGSTDASPVVAAALGATVLRIPHVPVSALRNQGMQVARAALVALVDADNEIAEGWLTSAVAHFKRRSVAVVGCDYSPPMDGTWVQALYDAFRGHPAGVESVRWLASGNMVVCRKIALEIGGFDETLDTCEDVDFCNRLRRRGYEIWSDSRMASTHYGDPATLTRLFRGELWRGRDALRVDLRGPIGWADLPSMVFPLIGLASVMVGLLSGLLAWHIDSRFLWLMMGAATVIPALSCLKAVRMSARIKDRHVWTFAGVWVVALVYDVARALSLVSRMPHRRANGDARHRQLTPSPHASE
jgi:Glycosyl transferase family 2